MTEDTIVHCKTLRVGDVVRTPSPGAPWLRVTAVDHENKTVTTDPRGSWQYGRGYVWVVLQGRASDGNPAADGSGKGVANAA